MIVNDICWVYNYTDCREYQISSFRTFLLFSLFKMQKNLGNILNINLNIISHIKISFKNQVSDCSMNFPVINFSITKHAEPTLPTGITP